MREGALNVTSSSFLIPLLAVLVCLVFPGPLLAARTFSIEDAYRMAMQTHESVRIAQEGLNRARAGEDKALSNFLPEVTVGGEYRRYTSEKSAGGFVIQPQSSKKANVAIRQSLFEGGKDWAGKKQAEFTTERSRIGLNVSREDIIVQTARAYYGVLKVQSDVDINKAALKRAEERRKVAEARFKVGEVTKSAVLRAEAEVAGAEAALTKSTAALRDAKDVLGRLTGVSEEIEVVKPEPLTPVASTPEELIKTAYGARRDYRQSLIDEKVASEGVSYAKGNFLPSLDLEGDYNWQSQSPTTTFALENSASASVVLSYPIFEGGLRKAELSEARSKVREAELKRMSLKRDIAVQVNTAYNNMVSLAALIDSFKRQVAFAEEDYKMVFEQFKFGIATTVDVIDADTTLVSAQSSLASSIYDHETSIIELKYADGTLLDYVNASSGGK